MERLDFILDYFSTARGLLFHLKTCLSVDKVDSSEANDIYIEFLELEDRLKALSNSYLEKDLT